MKNLIWMMGMVLTPMAQAQEFKVAKTSGTLIIKEVNHLTMEGHSGNDIIFSSRDRDRESDERAQGLRIINGMGLEDNTGLGLSVIEKGATVEVNQLKKMGGTDIKVLVPKGVTVEYLHTSPHGGDLEIKNFDGVLNISTVHNSINLINTYGSVKARTAHGDIDVALSAVPKNEISLRSAHGHVDLGIPVATNAELQLNSDWGELFVDPNFKIEISNADGMTKYSGKLVGKINGGGPMIEATSNHSNVYLRQK
jgi:hypothetical protein